MMDILMNIVERIDWDAVFWGAIALIIYAVGYLKGRDDTKDEVFELQIKNRELNQHMKAMEFFGPDKYDEYLDAVNGDIKS